jgi:hypothetical protein
VARPGLENDRIHLLAAHDSFVFGPRFLKLRIGVAGSTWPQTRRFGPAIVL